MENQPTLNIGMIGHVAHGKSTLVKALSGVKTVRFKSELQRNITIKLGYANVKIFSCEKCDRPDRYQSENKFMRCKKCDNRLKLVKHVSFIDCPGHDILMATMLSGTAIMDDAILHVAANESVPQPQTKEHLFAVQLMNIENEKNILIIQNKIDIVKKEIALQNYAQINEFVKATDAEDSPIIPISAQKNINIAAVYDFIVNNFKEIERKGDDGHMVLIRSFDINKPGKIKRVEGGVLGGSIISGKLKVGDEVEIRPGIIHKSKINFKCITCMTQPNYLCKPIFSKITSLKSEHNELDYAVPGGLIGVGTTIDPFLCKSDKLIGQILGIKNTLPSIFRKIEIKYNLFAKITAGNIEPIKPKENLLLNIGSKSVGAVVSEYCECISKSGDGYIVLDLIEPVCADEKNTIAISRKINRNWRLIGYGKIIDGVSINQN